MSDIKPITLAVLKDYFTAMSYGDVPDYPTALYSMLLMDGYIPKASAATEVRSALAQQPLSVPDRIEALERENAELLEKCSKEHAKFLEIGNMYLNAKFEAATATAALRDAKERKE